MSEIFNRAETGIIKLSGEKTPRLASISVAGASAKLPIVSLDEMSHHSRQQLDCSLDGTIHLLAASGGLGICNITFMDRIQRDCSKRTDKSLSALHKYGKLRKNLSGSPVVVRIHGNDGNSTLAKFTGIVKSCTASAQRKQGIDVLLVTYSMQGVMSCD